ncbi:hypothetical protein FQZ97_867330 [compost metagenome]
MAPTPASTAAPAMRRTPSPVGSVRFSADSSRPPDSSATASEVHAPVAYASSSSEVPTLAPLSAAPVRISPRIGPAHGAQSRPVPTPSHSGENTEACGASEMRRPSATSGRLRRSATRGNSSVAPNSASKAIAA